MRTPKMIITATAAAAALLPIAIGGAAPASAAPTPPDFTSSSGTLLIVPGTVPKLGAPHIPHSAQVSTVGGADGVLSGPNECLYYPPNYTFSSGDATPDSNDYDSQQDAQVSDSSLFGGTDSATSSAEAGYQVYFPDNTFTHVAITNTWHYRGNLSAFSNASNIPFVGGVSSSTATFSMYAEIQQNSLAGRVDLANKSLTNNSGLNTTLTGDVEDQNETVLSTGINPGDTITDFVHSETGASDSTSALTNARANADFRSGDSGGAYYAGNEEAEVWDYTLIPGWSITSC